jgi:hypothetical protein
LALLARLGDVALKRLDPAIFVTSALLAATLVYANIDGPPAGYTGAHGEQTCAATGCHDVPSSHVGQVRIHPDGPQHFDTVSYEVFVADFSVGESVHDWGFQLTIMDSLDQPYGELVGIDSVRTKTTPGAMGRSYLSHTTAGVPGGVSNGTEWHFQWVRPEGANITTPIYFYVAALLADGDGTAANDAVVTTLAIGPFCQVPVTGDTNGNNKLSSADVIWLIGYIFKGGTQPSWCRASGDVNCDAIVNTADITYLVNHIFKSGPAPCDVCPLILAGTWEC